MTTIIETDKESIGAVITSWFDSYVSGDLDGMMSCHSDDLVVIPQGHDPIYWAAELNLQVRGGTLFAAPAPRNLPRPPRDDPATKKTEKADPDHDESFEDIRRWISL